MLFTAVFFELPIVFAMYQAASKSRGRAGLYLMFQVTVFAYLCRWFVWTAYAIAASGVSIALALIAACVWGKIDQYARVNKNAAEKNEVVLLLKENELKEAHLQLVKQDEADRRILASDLHDQVLNDLKSLRQAIDGLKLTTDEVARMTKTSEIEALIDQTTVQVREVMENLTPSVLENLGLASALDDLLRRTGSRAKLRVRFRNEADSYLKKLSKIEQLLLFRTVQEALSNIVKHAQAGKVELSIKKVADELVILIADDGQGIPLDKERGQSRGLRYMRQRADLMGARIAWLPGRDNKGCQVEIKIQIKED